MSKTHDPYAGCDKGCTHDLVRGVLVTDLQHDGPYPDTSPFETGWLADRITEAATRQDSRIRT